MKKLIFALLLLQATSFADECRIINDNYKEITTVCNYNDAEIGAVVDTTVFAKNGTRCLTRQWEEDGSVWIAEYTLDNFLFAKVIDEYGFTTSSSVYNINSSEGCRHKWTQTKELFKK